MEKQLKNNEQMKVSSFDKGIGFALLNDINISKIEEQLENQKLLTVIPQTS